MNEKRFVRKDYMIWDNFKNEELYSLNYRHQCDDMCDILNSLNDEIELSETTSKATSHYNAFLESKISTLEGENEQLKKEKDSWKNIACQDLSKWSIFSNEVSVLQGTRDIDRFLEKYYRYCADMVMNDD